MAGGPRLALSGWSKLPFLLTSECLWHRNLRRPSIANLVSVASSYRVLITSHKEQ
ncbi:MAG: hypothetical protein M3Q05_05465 [Bacteroidota bacterium]|nr:hypothetical protein [Bacteroidota bacterium]